MPHSDGFSTLVPLDGLFAVCRLAADTPQPAWAAGALAGAFLSITRTAEELSIVAPEGTVPDGVRGESGWRCFRVAKGPQRLRRGPSGQGQGQAL